MHQKFAHIKIIVTLKFTWWMGEERKLFAQEEIILVPDEWTGFFWALCNISFHTALYDSPFPFSNSEIFTIITATQLCFLKHLVPLHVGRFYKPNFYLGFSFADLKKDGSWLVEVVWFYLMVKPCRVHTSSRLGTCLFIGWIIFMDDDISLTKFTPNLGLRMHKF